MSNIIKYVLLPITIGWLLYQFRPLGNGWIDNLSIQNESWTEGSINLPDFLIFNLVDGLWSFAMTALILIIWNNKNSAKIFWLIVVFAFVVGVELLQKMDLLAGTFDWLDLISNVVGFLLANLILNRNEKSSI